MHIGRFRPSQRQSKSSMSMPCPDYAISGRNWPGFMKSSAARVSFKRHQPCLPNMLRAESAKLCANVFEKPQMRHYPFGQPEIPYGSLTLAQAEIEIPRAISARTLPGDIDSTFWASMNPSTCRPSRTSAQARADKLTAFSCTDHPLKAASNASLGRSRANRTKIFTGNAATG